MPLKFTATGRPHAECPNCGRIHAVYRRPEYKEAAPRRYNCTHCKASWRSTPEEQAQLLEYFAKYADRKAGGVSNTRAPGVVDKKKPIQKNTKKTVQNPEPEPVPKPEPVKKKSSWIDAFLGGN